MIKASESILSVAVASPTKVSPSDAGGLFVVLGVMVVAKLFPIICSLVMKLVSTIEYLLKLYVPRRLFFEGVEGADSGS